MAHACNDFGRESSWCAMLVVSLGHGISPVLVAWVRAGGRLPLSTGSLLWYHNCMKSARKTGTKKRPGRPATGQGVQIGARWSEQTVAAIDTWAASQADEPSRSEAVRRLVEIGLKKK